MLTQTINKINDVIDKINNLSDGQYALAIRLGTVAYLRGTYIGMWGRGKGEHAYPPSKNYNLVLIVTLILTQFVQRTKLLATLSRNQS